MTIHQVFVFNVNYNPPVDNHATNATSATSDNDTLTSEATAEDKIIGLQSCFLRGCS